VPYACKLIVLFAVMFYLVNAVYRFDFLVLLQTMFQINGDEYKVLDIAISVLFLQ